MSRRQTHMDFARAGGATLLAIKNLVRRMIVKATGGVTWKLEGFKDESGNAESVQAEVFAGIGFVARPVADGMPEAVVVHVLGSPNHPCVVAARDRAVEAAVIEVAGMQPGESMVYTPDRIFKLAANGDILVGELGGDFTAVALADHTHDVDLPVTGGGGGAVKGVTGGSSSNSRDTKVT